MHTIFVYGTLKRGFPNHDPTLREAVYVGLYRTVEAFPLVIGGPWRTPYLIDEPGEGLVVHGEVFQVDDTLLAELDYFESTHLPNGYRRISLAVETIDREGKTDAWTYVRERQYIDGIHCEPLADYPLDGGYVVPALR